MNLLFESMLRVETDHHVCRIWRGEVLPGVQVTDETLRDVALEKLMEIVTVGSGIKETVALIAQFERVNSVEIVSKVDGCGVCVHKDWP